MTEYIVGNIVEEEVCNKADLFDMLVLDQDIQLKYKKVIRLTLIDKKNNLLYCLLPKKSFEEKITVIDDIKKVCIELVGLKLLVEEGDKLTKEETAAYNIGDEIFAMIIKNNNGIKMASYSLVFQEKDPKGIKVMKDYEKFIRNTSFKAGKGNSNYREEGYDVDASFGGEADAYWNID